MGSNGWTGGELKPGLLLDTHVLIRWIIESRKLSREQFRAIDSALRRGEPLAFSAMTLVEIAMLSRSEGRGVNVAIEEFFADLSANPDFELLPISYDVAIEAGWLEGLKDPADRVIAATARVHRLRLVTSDQRMIESKLVPVLE